MSDIDPYAISERRFPRVITMDEILGLPRLVFQPGIDTAIFLSQERDDARYFRQGICWQTSDHVPYTWHQKDFDETHYCLKGKIRLLVKDADGLQITLEAKVGEHIYLPAGYEYTLVPTGVDTAFFWSSGPSPRYGLAELPEYSEALSKLRNGGSHE